MSVNGTGWNIPHKVSTGVRVRGCVKVTGQMWCPQESVPSSSTSSQMAGMSSEASGSDTKVQQFLLDFSVPYSSGFRCELIIIKSLYLVGRKATGESAEVSVICGQYTPSSKFNEISVIDSLQNY